MNQHEHRVDVLTRSLRGLRSRRAAMHGLAALGLGLGTARLADPATAKKRKKKRKKGKPRVACRPGQIVDVVDVPGTGAGIITAVLKQGQRYRLRASGFWRSNATHGQDAFADFELANPTKTVTKFNGVRLGLAVDGNSPDQWGSYSTTHVYERVLIGEGKGLEMVCNDVVHADNAGTLRVEVICA